jgi:alpha-galactosidase
LANGDRLLTVLNRGNTTAKTSVSLARLGLSSGSYCEYHARNLWTGHVSTIHASVDTKLDSHATSVYRITPKHCTAITPTGMVFHTPSGLCMTASSGKVTFEKCRALDSQVWRVDSQGSKLTLSPLSDASACLAATKDGKQVSLAKCDGARTAWSHYVTGHLRNEQGGGCLTGGSGGGSIVPCVVDSAAQIFGLPSGVQLGSV